MTENKNTTLPAGSSAMDKVRYAFAVGKEHEEELLEDEIELLSDIATTISRRRLTAIAIMFLGVHRPLNTLGANLVQMGEFLFDTGPVTTFLQQFMGPLYSHERLVRTMEKRGSIDKLIDLLEESKY